MLRPSSDQLIKWWETVVRAENLPLEVREAVKELVAYYAAPGGKHNIFTGLSAEANQLYNEAVQAAIKNQQNVIDPKLFETPVPPPDDTST